MSRFLIVMLTGFTVAACGGGGRNGGDTPPPSGAPTYLSNAGPRGTDNLGISSDGANAVAATLTLDIKAFGPASGAVACDPSVATVDDSGWITSCADGQLDLLSAAAITDIATALSRARYDALVYGDDTAPVVLGTTTFGEREGHQIVTVKKQLWLIGGVHNDFYENDLWELR